MFAIFKTGGKEYKVKEGDKLAVEKLSDVKAEKKVEFPEVLMVGAKVGAPFVAGAKVLAEVVTQIKGEKVIVFKKKRRQNYRRTKGHRQQQTVVKITGIKE